MAKKTADHIHKYERIRLGPNRFIVFRCLEAHCSHNIRKEFAKGKLTRCNRCDNVMILDTFSMKFQFPHCRACTKKKDEGVEKLAELFR